MSNWRFEMYQYRQALMSMRQGDSDRVIARSGLMGRKKLASIRKQAINHNWLSPAIPYPTPAHLPKSSSHLRASR